MNIDTIYNDYDYDNSYYFSKVCLYTNYFSERDPKLGMSRRLESEGNTSTSEYNVCNTNCLERESKA